MRRIQLGERQRLWWPELTGNELAAAPEFRTSTRMELRCTGKLVEGLRRLLTMRGAQICARP